MARLSPRRPQSSSNHRSTLKPGYSRPLPAWFAASSRQDSVPGLPGAPRGGREPRCWQPGSGRPPDEHRQLTCWARLGTEDVAGSKTVARPWPLCHEAQGLWPKDKVTQGQSGPKTKSVFLGLAGFGGKEPGDIGLRQWGVWGARLGSRHAGLLGAAQGPAAEVSEEPRSLAG